MIHDSTRVLVSFMGRAYTSGNAILIDIQGCGMRIRILPDLWFSCFLVPRTWPQLSLTDFMSSHSFRRNRRRILPGVVLNMLPTNTLGLPSWMDSFWGIV